MPFDRGLLRGGIAHRNVCLLLRDRVGLQQILIPGRGRGGKIKICLRALQVSLCHLQLLVQLRSFDGGHQLPFFDMGANVEEPLLLNRRDRTVQITLLSAPIA